MAVKACADPIVFAARFEAPGNALMIGRAYSDGDSVVAAEPEAGPAVVEVVCRSSRALEACRAWSVSVANVLAELSPT